ncbi:family 20 glycosylhydrolase [Paenibacillus hodogayensis]|uniref:beta-N-acetylhexosaminidase n=1 Tax=Paenibacillus hodogayensis TaxID=279208 RepID=A0ABV5VPV1_9BACL
MINSIPTLIPAPKRMCCAGIRTLDEGWTVTVEAGALASVVTRTALRQLIFWLAEHWSGKVLAPHEAGGAGNPEEQPPYRIRLEETEACSERYRLTAGPSELHIAGGPTGILHGVQTLIQLLQPGTSSGLLRLPLVEIEDEPDIPIRGMFAECSWGSDLMELEDWKAMVDEMVHFKLNTLGIGIYGCWGSRYPADANSRSEFLFAPVLDDPGVLPERRIGYFDPVAKRTAIKTYRPTLYENDGFGQLVAYAAERGIRVIPQFNGPGHSLLLPRLYPNISAVDERGEATGYGYSLTHPDTFPLLKRMMKRVIDRYMLPYGQTWFHIGMDEITGWSAADLAVHTPRQLLELYLTEIGGYLIANGIEKVMIWHDMAESLTGFDESFESLLEKCGLAGKLVIQWWNYTMPVCSVKQVRGAEGWVAPSTGYMSGMFYQDYVDNVENRVNEGVEQSFPGAVAYTVYSPTFRRNTAYLAEKCWNTRRRDAAEFDRTYAAWIVSDEPECWAKGMSAMRKLFEYSSTFTLLAEIGVFFSSADSIRAYPAGIVRSVLATDGVHKAYRVTRALARNALLSFEQGKAVPGREYELRVIRFECRRVAGLIDGLLGLSDAVRAMERLRNGPIAGRCGLAAVGERLERELDALDRLLAEMQGVLPAYMVFVGLREYMFLREAMRKQAEQLTLLSRDEAILRGEADVPLPCVYER